MGRDFAAYYKGNPKLGDTPSLSTIDGFEPITGQITVENTWDAAPKDTDFKVGSQWWTDSYAPADYWHNCAGARNQIIVRDEIMEDWGQRWLWLRE